VVPAGVPRKPGMTRDDLFNTNAKIVFDITKEFAKACPRAMLLIISNPVNSMVPLAAEVLKNAGCYDKKKLMGITNLDICRAKTFVGGYVEGVKKTAVSGELKVPVIGGHAGTTILPLLSQAKHGGGVIDFDATNLEALTKRIQFGGDEVVQAKAGAGSATLSMAHAGADFTDYVVNAAKGKATRGYAFVESTIIPDCSFFASELTFDKDGVKEFHPIGKITEREQGLLKAMLPELKSQIDKGVSFAKGKLAGK